jgi:hypothetical protein
MPSLSPVQETGIICCGERPHEKTARVGAVIDTLAERRYQRRNKQNMSA